MKKLKAKPFRAKQFKLTKQMILSIIILPSFFIRWPLFIRWKFCLFAAMFLYRQILRDEYRQVEINFCQKNSNQEEQKICQFLLNLLLIKSALFFILVNVKTAF